MLSKPMIFKATRSLPSIFWHITFHKIHRAANLLMLVEQIFSTEVHKNVNRWKIFVYLWWFDTNWRARSVIKQQWPLTSSIIFLETKQIEVPLSLKSSMMFFYFTQFTSLSFCPRHDSSLKAGKKVFDCWMIRRQSFFRENVHICF